MAQYFWVVSFIIAESAMIYAAGMTNTIYAVVVVELVGIKKMPKALALHNIITSVAAMLAAPIGG